MTSEITHHLKARLRTGGDVPQLLSEIASARQAHPGDYGLELLYGDALLKNGALADAKPHLESLETRFPQRWQSALRLADLYFRTDDDVGMQAALDRSQALGAPEPQVLRLRARAALRQGRHRAALDSFQRLAKLVPPNAAALAQQASLHQALGEYPQALANVEQALALQPDAPLPGGFEHAIIEVHGVDEGIDALTGMIERHPDNVGLTSTLARLLDDCGRPAELLGLYRSHKHAFDENALVLVMSQNLPEDLFGDMAAYVAETTEHSPRRRILLARKWHLSQGDEEAAKRLEYALPAYWQHKPAGTATATAVLRSDKPTQPRLNGWNGPEIATVLNPENRGLVLAFSGLKCGLLDFTTRGDSRIDHVLAALGLSVAYFKDSQRLLYLNGLSTLAEDYGSTLARLRELIAEIGAPRLFTLSFSAGGFAAIRYGLALGAECALCFSPPTNLTGNFLSQDPRGKVVQYRLGRHFSDDMLDLRPRLQDAAGRMAVHIYYGAGQLADRRHAEHLQGTPGVNLHPVQEVDEHAIWHHVEQNGGLRNTLIRHYRLNPS